MIRMHDLAAQHARYRDEIESAVLARLRGGDYVGADAVAAFEAEFAAYVGGESHAVGCSSGTDAIELVVRALGYQPGDEVIVPAFTFLGSVEPLVRAGLVPVVVDVGDDFILDPDAVRKATTPRTRAVLAVWLYGSMRHADALAAAASSRGIDLLEDCAQAHGAHVGCWVRAGSIGRAAAFSCYPTKNLAAAGNAGVAVFRDAETAERARRIRNHGWDGKRHAEFGFNAKLDGLQADILRVKLRHLDAEVARRREQAALYDQCLVDTVLRPRMVPGHAWNLYTIRVANRDAVASALAERGVQTAVHYREPVCCSLDQISQDRALPGLTPGLWRDIINAHRFAGSVLSLPIGSHLSDADILRVCEAIAEVTR